MAGQLHVLAAAPHAKIPWDLLKRWLGGFQSWSGYFEKIFAPDGDQMTHQMSNLQAGHYSHHTIPTHDRLHSEILLYPYSEFFQYFCAGLTKNVWVTSWLRTTQAPWICVQKTFFQISCFLTSIILVQVTCKHLVLKCLSYYCSLSSQGIYNLPSFDNTSKKTLTITCTLFNSLFTFTIKWQRGKCVSWTTVCYNWFLPSNSVKFKVQVKWKVVYHLHNNDLLI